jgi:hypothetical protein
MIQPCPCVQCRNIPAVPSPARVIVRLAAEWDEPAARVLCDQIEALSRQVARDSVIHHGRNLIFRHRIGAEDVAVKRFPVTGVRRLVYRWRTSKAVRAFDHAVRLLALGIGTPRPLAAVETRRGRALLASFYCCAFVPVFREARALRLADDPDRTALLELLGAFIGRLHESGVLHHDLTSGNVLLVPAATRPGGVAFQLVDINRMSFGRVGVHRGLANLAKLRLDDETELLTGYCRARNLASREVLPYYRLRLALRAVAQTIRERTRPLRRRLGL